MLRSPDPPTLLPLSWCESPTAPCRSLLPVRRDEPVLLGAPGEEERARAACFSARLAHGRRAALEVLISSSMLSYMEGKSFKYITHIMAMLRVQAKHPQSLSGLSAVWDNTKGQERCGKDSRQAERAMPLLWCKHQPALDQDQTRSAVPFVPVKQYQTYLFAVVIQELLIDPDGVPERGGQDKPVA
jgi:hypothetical protein